MFEKPSVSMGLSGLKCGVVLLGLAGISLLASCTQTSEVPRASRPPAYARQLVVGEAALRKLDLAQWPDLAGLTSDDPLSLEKALKRSLGWFVLPSTQKHFPVQGITHEAAHLSTYALAQMLRPLDVATLKDEFDLYMSVGWDGQGTVLLTGYYSPVFEASLTRTDAFAYPLYRLPQTQKPWPTRREIAEQDLLAGNELIWLSDPFEVYLAQIQGSAKLTLPDGSTRYVGYAGSNDRSYTSIARQMVAEGKLDANQLNLPAIRAYFKDHPRELDQRLLVNERFIFFKDYEPDVWPSGSLGFQVTPLRTVATDKRIFPRGGPLLIEAAIVESDGTSPRQLRLMVDQDTGGAIRAPGRGDLYFGIGSQAEAQAGMQLAEGKMFYLILKPQRFAYWRHRLEATRSSY